MKTILAIFLILHGLVHAILAMAPNPDTPDAGPVSFFSRSWLFTNTDLSETAVKTIAIILAAMATIGFIATGLDLLDILVPFAWWRILATTSAVVSLLLLIIFWHRYLIVGIAIDVVLLATLLSTNWTPE